MDTNFEMTLTITEKQKAILEKRAKDQDVSLEEYVKAVIIAGCSPYTHQEISRAIF